MKIHIFRGPPGTARGIYILRVPFWMVTTNENRPLLPGRAGRIGSSSWPNHKAASRQTARLAKGVSFEQTIRQVDNFILSKFQVD